MRAYELVLVPKDLLDSEILELITVKQAVSEFKMKSINDIVDLARKGYLSLYLTDAGIRVVKSEVMEAICDVKYATN